MKPALVAAVVLAFAIHLAPRCEAKEKAAQVTASANEQQPSTLAAVFACAVLADRETTTTRNDSSQNDAPDRNEPSQWIFVIIAGVTALVVGWQSWETRKAAQATRDSVGHMEKQTNIQAAGLQQWVDVEPLGCYIQTPPAGKRGFPFTVNLRFEAVNNTPYPFDIQKVVTKIGMWPYEWEVFTVETNVTLASQEKSRSKRYAFYVPTQSITEEGFRRGTIVTINGDVTFKNCLGRTQTDCFGGIYRCGQVDSQQEGIFQYLEALGIVPERTNEKENPPNPN